MSRGDDARAALRQARSNRLIAAFPIAERRRLIAHASEVPLVYGAYVHRSGEVSHYVYFPLRGLVSLVQRLADGNSVQIATIGRDGIVGVAGAMGQKHYITDAVVQIPGSALRVRATPLRAAMRRNQRLSQAILSSTAELTVEMALTAACNAHHRLEQRLARWLVTAHDSVDQGAITISHSFLSAMLGTQRTGVTAALAKFKRAGLVDTGYGGIAIRNRAGLEALACECYHRLRRRRAAPRQPGTGSDTRT